MNTQPSLLRAVLLPIAAIVALYALFFGVPKANDAQTARRQAETIRGQQPAGDPLQAAQRQLALTMARIGELEHDEKAFAHKLASAGSGGDAAARTATDTVRALTALITRHALSVAEDGIIEGEGLVAAPAYLKPPAAPAGHEQDAFTVPHSAAAPAAGPLLWRVRLVGRYADVMRLMEAIPASAPHVTPVYLHMAEPAGTSTVREWTLLLWL